LLPPKLSRQPVIDLTAMIKRSLAEEAGVAAQALAARARNCRR